MIQKRNVIVFSIILMILLVSGIVFSFWKNSQTPPTEVLPQSQTNKAPADNNSSGSTNTAPSAARTSAELIDSITRQAPSLLDANQQPVFGITNTYKGLNGWYVVTITNKVDPTIGTAKLVMKDSGDTGIVIVAGPGTKFSRDDFSFPEDIWKQL